MDSRRTMKIPGRACIYRICPVAGVLRQLTTKQHTLHLVSPSNSLTDMFVSKLYLTLYIGGIFSINHLLS